MKTEATGGADVDGLDLDGGGNGVYGWSLWLSWHIGFRFVEDDKIISDVFG